jgi:hypothetical protein
MERWASRPGHFTDEERALVFTEQELGRNPEPHNCTRRVCLYIRNRFLCSHFFSFPFFTILYFLVSLFFISVLLPFCLSTYACSLTSFIYFSRFFLCIFSFPYFCYYFISISLCLSFRISGKAHFKSSKQSFYNLSVPSTHFELRSFFVPCRKLWLSVQAQQGNVRILKLSENSQHFQQITVPVQLWQ